MRPDNRFTHPCNETVLAKMSCDDGSQPPLWNSQTCALRDVHGDGLSQTFVIRLHLYLSLNCHPPASTIATRHVPSKAQSDFFLSYYRSPVWVLSREFRTIAAAQPQRGSHPTAFGADSTSRIRISPPPLALFAFPAPFAPF